MYDTADAPTCEAYTTPDPSCTLPQTPGTVYNDHRSQGDQFFWNFSNTNAAIYFIESVLSVLNASADVDGSFTDDGACQEA